MGHYFFTLLFVDPGGKEFHGRVEDTPRQVSQAEGQEDKAVAWKVDCKRKSRWKRAPVSVSKAEVPTTFPVFQSY